MLCKCFIQNLDRHVGITVTRFFLNKVDGLKDAPHTARTKLVFEREASLEDRTRTHRLRTPRGRRRHRTRTRRQRRIAVADA